MLYQEVVKSYLSGQVSLSDVLAYGNNFGEYALTLDFQYYQRLIESLVCSFEEFAVEMKKRKELYEVLFNDNFFRKLLYNLTITNADISKLIELVSSEEESQNLCKNTFLLSYLLDSNLLTVEKFLEFFNSKNSLQYVLQNKEFFQSFALSKENYEKLYSLCKNNKQNFKSLCTNLSVLKGLFKNNVATIKRFIELVEQHEVLKEFVEFEKFFEFLRIEQYIDRELLEMLYVRIQNSSQLLFSTCCWNMTLLMMFINEGIATKHDIQHLLSVCCDITKENKRWLMTKLDETL